MTALATDDRGVIAACPSCGQKNRLAYDRLSDTTRCGRCKADLPAASLPVDVASAADFDSLVASASIPVVVDFWAPWCGPCRMVAPIVEEIAGERPELKVVKLNTDENIQTASEYQIMAIPTLLLFRNGQVAKRIQGAMPKKRLEAEIEPALA